MDRFWLLTSTFYGNWLPGDPRGFVSRVRDVRPDEVAPAARREHDAPGTPYDADLDGLHRRDGTHNDRHPTRRQPGSGADGPVRGDGPGPRLATARGSGDAEPRASGGWGGR